VTNIFFVLSVVTGFGALAWGYGTQGHSEYVRWFFLLGAVWL